jgi:hypothetical protein
VGEQEHEIFLSAKKVIILNKADENNSHNFSL